VIEKAKVDAEVMRLSRLRSEHSESQYANRARLRMATEDAARLERQIAALDKDLARRLDTQGEKFRIVLAGKTYRDRVEAGHALVYLVNDHRDDHLRGKPGIVTLGEIAGFKLEYRSTRPDKIVLRGDAEHVANVSPSPVGSISSLEHAARCFEEQVLKCREELDRCRNNTVELTALGSGVFEHEERYRELLARQGELIDKLDITKNQASARQAAETTDNAESAAVAVPEFSTRHESEAPKEDLSSSRTARQGQRLPKQTKHGLRSQPFEVVGPTPAVSVRLSA
jgi:hypothetical protein